MAHIFVTGFPGFLGSELVRRVLARKDRPSVTCLVQPKFLPLAAARVGEIERDLAGAAKRIALVEGDITVQGLGLANRAKRAREVTEIFHFAAVYDLSVAREVGMKVNFDGTRHLLDFAEECAGLDRVQYVSTCYVSGRWVGIFRESDLEKGQAFNNFYEETKYLAEVDVRRRMAGGLPATIFRPAVVTGDSVTGETQKYDGPYYVLRWLLKQPAVAVLPVPGDPERTRVNLVPRDFVIDAIDALAEAKVARGKCYHLADPDPPTIDETIRMMGEATGKMIVRVPMPAKIAKGAIDHVPGVSRLLEIPSSVIDYYLHPTFYDTANAEADLGALGIRCPRLADYLPRLVSFMKVHPEIHSEAMV
jgi:nucleoside-diphosphate-sugar epimerase